MIENFLTIVGLALMTTGLVIATLTIAICFYIWNYGSAAGLAVVFAIAMAIFGAYLVFMADR